MCYNKAIPNTYARNETAGTAIPSPLQDVKVKLVDSIDDLWAMKQWAAERRETPLGFDTETGGFQPTKDELRLIQLGDKHTGWVVPWALWGGGALEILRNYEGELVAHNSSFDCRFLTHKAGWEVPWHKIHDTMTMAHLVDPLRPKGLKPLAGRLVDKNAVLMQGALNEGMKKQGWTWADVPVNFGPYWAYAGFDPVLTCHIWDKLHAEVETMYSEVYDFERAVTRVLSAMMLKGMLVDVDYIGGALAKVVTYSAEVRTWLKDTFGITSPMAGMKIAETLEAYGQEILWRTDSGNPQIDKEALKFYQDNAAAPLIRELCTTILSVRHAEKMAGTYLENLLKLRDADDLVHCSIWSLGARTSRMSITDPALQTLPRDDMIVRGAFIPRPGHVLISIDADQIEARLAAHFSKDPGLIKAFIEADEGGRDFFCGVASEIFRTDIRKGDIRRQHTKNTVYGSLYGAGAAKMALTAGVTLDVMAPIKQAFDARYPGLKNLSNKINTEAMEHTPARVITPLGRRLVLDQGREYTQGTNALIQGHAAEVLKRGMLDLDAAGYGSSLLLPVHDEIILEVPEADAEEALRVVSYVLTDRKNYAVPITWDGKIMKDRWVKT